MLEGYNIIRTLPPKDFEGRGDVNFARTTPEFPAIPPSARLSRPDVPDPDLLLTVRSRNLAPDDADLGAPDLLLGPVDVCHPLAEIELCLLRGVDALNLDDARRGVLGVAAPLVRQVSAPA
jgi:hypothetical protein